MHRRRPAPIVLAALVLALAAPAAALADCTYDFNFSHTSSGDVRVTVSADCGLDPVHQTTLSVFPGGGFVRVWGGFAQVIVDDAPGSQLYCANATSTFWHGMFLAIDDGGSECASL